MDSRRCRKKYKWPCGKKCKNRAPNKAGASILITADNVLDEISVNGTPLTLLPPLDDWPTLKGVKTVLAPGDKITVKAHNFGDPFLGGGNPAGILAEINYFDCKGLPAKILTSQLWTCNGKPALEQGANGLAGTAWTNVLGGNPMADISTDAQWIWEDTFPQPESTICELVIPCKTKPKKSKPKNPFPCGKRCKNRWPHVKDGSIAITVDNILAKVAVNGFQLTPLAGSYTWPTVKTFSGVKIAPGDKIVVKGHNLNPNPVPGSADPAGILATITYIGCDGRTRILDTSKAWTCAGKAALEEGANNQSGTPWYNGNGGALAGISGTAQWIWADVTPGPQYVKCWVKIPCGKKRSKCHLKKCGSC